MKFDDYHITELDNGLKIISEKIPHFRSISLGFWIFAGSRSENKTNNGITHLIEHLLFKGTTTRSYRDIAVAFDSLGAEYNAFTDKENSCFYADFIDSHLDKCLQLLFDVVFNPSFESLNIKTEKKIIYEEIKMVEDNPSENIFNYFYKDLFAGHPLSLTVLGQGESLKNINQKEIWKYFRQNYNLKNCVLSAAGNIGHDKLVREVEKNIDGFNHDAGANANQVKKTRPDKRKFKNVYSHKTKAVHLCYGGLGCSRTHQDKYPLSVFTVLFGGSMSSRLFQKIREEHGLSYSIFSTNSQYVDTGVVLTYAGSSPKNSYRIIELIEDELKDIERNGLTEEEVIRAKENLKGSIVLNVEDISSRMFRMGKALLVDKKVLTIDDILKKIDNVTSSQLIEIVNKYYNPEDQSWVILGDLKGQRQ
ncbi:MAG: insulinase family protein [Actinomycetia bacterium]|nr:insulinase family protein [Actinomycetes bacterium]